MFTLTLRNLCIRAFRALHYQSCRRSYDDLDDLFIDSSLGRFVDDWDVVMWLIRLDSPPATVDKFMITHALDADPTCYDDALDLAAELGNRGLVEFFIDRGAPLDWGTERTRPHGAD